MKKQFSETKIEEAIELIGNALLKIAESMSEKRGDEGFTMAEVMGNAVQIMVDRSLVIRDALIASQGEEGDEK